MPHTTVLLFEIFRFETLTWSSSIFSHTLLKSSINLVWFSQRSWNIVDVELQMSVKRFFSSSVRLWDDESLCEAISLAASAPVFHFLLRDIAATMDSFSFSNSLNLLKSRRKTLFCNKYLQKNNNNADSRFLCKSSVYKFVAIQFQAITNWLTLENNEIPLFEPLD